MEKRNQAAKLIIGTVVIIIAVLFLAGIVAGHDLKYKAAPLSREDIAYKQVEAPQASGYDGTIQAADWAALYPDIVFSMGANKDNSDVVDYLKLDPYLVEIYEDYGFAKDYGSARGHAYTLEDVNKTERPHKTANCLTCKTPNLTKKVQDEGKSVYSMSFEDVYAEITQNGGETVSCYTCHGNNAGNATAPGENLTVTHGYITEALGANIDSIDPGILLRSVPHRVLLQPRGQGDHDAAFLDRNDDAGRDLRLLHPHRLLRLDAGKHRREDAEGAAPRNGNGAFGQARQVPQLRGLPYADR